MTILNHALLALEQEIQELKSQIKTVNSNIQHAYDKLGIKDQVLARVSVILQAKAAMRLTGDASQLIRQHIIISNKVLNNNIYYIQQKLRDYGLNSEMLDYERRLTKYAAKTIQKTGHYQHITMIVNNYLEAINSDNAAYLLRHKIFPQEQQHIIDMLEKMAVAQRAISHKEKAWIDLKIDSTLVEHVITKNDAQSLAVEMASFISTETQEQIAKKDKIKNSIEDILLSLITKRAKFLKKYKRASLKEQVSKMLDIIFSKKTRQPEKMS